MNSTTTSCHPLVSPLAIAGTLPFLGCAIGAWRVWSLPFDPASVAITYSAVILSFLAGTNWSFFLTQPSPKAWVILWSNTLPLLAWAAVWLGPASPVDTCVFLALCFLMALWVDNRLRIEGFIAGPYFRLRAAVTAIVVICLVVTATGTHVARVAHGVWL